jgi:hypothetical protein
MRRQYEEEVAADDTSASPFSCCGKVNQQVTNHLQKSKMTTGIHHPTIVRQKYVSFYLCIRLLWWPSLSLSWNPLLSSYKLFHCCHSQQKKHHQRQSSTQWQKARFHPVDVIPSTVTRSTILYTLCHQVSCSSPPLNSNPSPLRFEKIGHPPCTLRIVSWNVLSPSFVSKDKFPHCDPIWISWEYRMPLIVKQLLDYQPDIICLQEMSIYVWDHFLHAIQGTSWQSSVPIPSSSTTTKPSSDYNYQYIGIHQHLYDGISNKRSIKKQRYHKPIPSTAILIRQHFADVIRAESRSRALIAVLSIRRQQQQPPSSISNHVLSHQYLYLANVHLEAGRNHDHVRFSQLQSLLKRMKIQVQRDQPSYCSSNNTSLVNAPTDSLTRLVPNDPLLLVAGDCNFLPNDRIYRLMQPPTPKNNNKLHRNTIQMNGEQWETLPLPFLPMMDAYHVCPPVTGPIRLTY